MLLTPVLIALMLAETNANTPLQNIPSANPCTNASRTDPPLIMAPNIDIAVALATPTINQSVSFPTAIHAAAVVGPRVNRVIMQATAKNTSPRPIFQPISSSLNHFMTDANHLTIPFHHSSHHGLFASIY